MLDSTKEGRKKEVVFRMDTFESHCQLIAHSVGKRRAALSDEVKGKM